MSSTLIITVKSARSAADVVSTLLKDTSAPRTQAVALSKFFSRVAAGLEACTFDVQTGASPVRASQTVTLTYASISDQDTVTVAGRALKCVTGTPAATQQFKKVTDATATAKNLAALINSDAVTSLVVSATSALGVVTVKALTVGEEGNFITVATSNGTGFGLGAATLASGAGGADTVAVSFSRGLA